MATSLAELLSIVSVGDSVSHPAIALWSYYYIMTVMQSLTHQGADAMTTIHAPTSAAFNATWETAPTQTINAGGVQFAYRRLGPSTGVPVVFLTHLAAVLDNWDPRIVDGIAAQHP